MLRRRTIFPLAGALLLAGTLAACSSSASSGSGTAAAESAAKSPIVVCGDLALAGPYAQIGETDNWGATAYFHHINATGGILGHKVDYVVMNNQSSASESELIARKCILSDHAQFIVGPESGADTEAALPIAIAYHTILISLSSGWQTNGYPASELNSWGFPGFYDVFYEDQLASVQQLIVPRHYTRVALLEDNCGSVCLANQGSVQKLASQYGFKLVTTQIDQVGATDVTPQVLAMLAAKPQIILFGLVPGTDSITAIRAIRAQNASIPISECSACELPSFIAAAGGASVMHNIYVLGSMQDWLAAASKGTSAEAKQTAAGLQAYFAGMKSTGYTSANQLDNSQEGWDAGLEINWAVTSAGTLDETTVMQKLQHLDINTLGIVWARSPANYENISQVLAAMEVIAPDGTVTLYSGSPVRDRGRLPPHPGGTVHDNEAAGGSQREPGLQQGQGLVDALEHVLDGPPVVGPVVPRHRDRHDDADDRAGRGADGQVIRRPPGPLGQGLADHGDGAGELVHGPGPDLGHGHGEGRGLPEQVEVGLGVGGEHFPASRPDGGDRGEPGRLPFECLDHAGVHVVLQHDVFLAGEVPEERAR